MNTKIAHITIVGFDTHEKQKGNLNALLKSIDDSLLAFIFHMANSQIYQDTTILFTTEFSRTITENSGAGTDHGYGTTFVLIGPKVKGAIYNDFELKDISDQYLIGVETNVVSLYRAVTSHLGYNPDPIFDKIAPMNIFY